MLDLLIPRAPATNASWGPLDPRWYGILGGKTASGATVNENTAMNYSAVWCATRILSETVAQLPLVMMKQTGKMKERATGHRLYRVLHDQPNPENDTFTFRDMLTACLVNAGTCYAEKVRDGRGNIVELWPIHTSRIPPTNIGRDKDTGELFYRVLNDGQPASDIPDSDMLRVVGPLSTDGITGKGIIRQARESIGLGLETERFGAAFFGNDARPSILLRPKIALSEKAHQNLRRSWNRLYQGAGKSNRVGVLEEEIAVEKLGVPPEDAQFLQTRQHNITEIARWYRIPPHMLADLSRATFSNIEHLGIEFVMYALTPWLRRWEEALRSQLLTEEEQQDHLIRFNVNALLRGDAKSRSQFYREMFGIGAFSINDILELEDRNPIEDGDEHYRPLNMAPVWQEVPLKVAQSQPATPPPQDDDGGAKAASALDNRDIMLREAASDALKASASRMLYKEAQAAKRAANQPSEFLGWLDTFYGHHESQFAEAVDPCVRVVLAVTGVSSGATEAAKRLAAWHVERSRQLLLTASEVPASKLAESVSNAMGKAWRESEAATLASELLTAYDQTKELEAAA